MFDTLPSHPDTAEPTEHRRGIAALRRQQRACRSFLGVDIEIEWTGSARELVRALHSTGLERIFGLHSVSRGTRVLWHRERAGAVSHALGVAGHGPCRVRFDATPEAGNRAEAHLPRLLESIASRMVWHRVEKRHERPAPGAAHPAAWHADWSVRPVDTPCAGSAA